MCKKLVKKFFDKKRKTWSQNQTGQSLIELILTIALTSIILVAIANGVITSREAFARSEKSIEANILLEREIEAIRVVKEVGWNSITTAGTYHVEQSGNTWTVVSGDITENGFTRSFEVKDVCRAVSDSPPTDCSNQGTIVDPSTKEITVSVNWSFLGNSFVSSTFFLTRYSGNQTWTQTTKAQFDQGIHQGTVSTNNSGGEIEIDFTPTPPPSCQDGHWQAPQVCDTYDTSGTDDGQGVFVKGNYAYSVKGGTGDGFYIFDITDPENISLTGSASLGAIGYDVYVSGNYAYVATSGIELMVVDISNKSSPFVAGPGLNLPRGDSAYSIFVVGNTAFLGRDNGRDAEFYTIDISNPLSPSILDSIGGNHTYDVYVSGNYAYLASADNGRELDIIDISNPSNISRAGSYDAPGRTNARGVFVVGTTAYLTTLSGGNDFYMLNVSNPASVSLISSLELGGNSYSVFVDGTLAFIGTSNGSAEFQVVDISNPNNPFVYGSLDLNGLVNSVFVVGDFAFITGADDTAEFQVIKGGGAPVGGGGGGCTGNWQAPEVCKTNNTTGADGRDVFVQGNYAYMVSGGNGADFFIYNISDPENFFLAGSLDLGGINVYNVYVLGDYAYVSTSHDTQELMVIDISNKASPSLVGAGYDIPDTRNARGIFVVGNTAYIVRDGGGGDDFFVLDITDPLSISLLDSMNISGSAYDIYVSGNYAYVTSANNSQELQVIDISDPLNISKIDSFDTPGTDANARNIFVKDTTAYFTTLSSGDELFILDVSTPSNVTLISSFDLGHDGYGLYVEGDFLFVGTRNGTSEFQVIDISNPSSPSLYGSTDLSDRTYGVWAFGDYAVIANAANAGEFQLIKGGSLFSGTFISSIFDAGSNVGFNLLTWNATLPAQTNVRFQIAANSDGSTWNFGGPNGSATSFYYSPGAVALNFISAQYIRYKITLSSDVQDLSPTIEDITINYSP